MSERSQPGHGDRDLIVLAVIVLYKTRPCDSVAFGTLRTAISQLQPEQDTIRVLLYDNTSGGGDPGPLPEYTSYQSSSQNEGISGAYNFALRKATAEGFTWMLTLDQDTQLPSDFLVRMCAIARRLQDVQEAGAIVPHLLHGEMPVSPVHLRPWGVSYLPRDRAGFMAGEIHAMNSASLFRVTALRQIGGFDPHFWLDYQDADVYRKLHQCGRRVYIAEDLDVVHDLSLRSEHQSMAEERFWNFLQAESAFCDLYRGRIGGVALTARLLGRFWLRRGIGAIPAIRRLTRKALYRRIFQSRRTRIQMWRNDMQRRMLDAGTISNSQERAEGTLAISVCMAAYNGERYITAQLNSILSQLRATDEVIVVDDASTDGTKEKVLALKDPRVRLIEHAKNHGVSHTFEDAIRAASGSILFLSDQDDLWKPNKVAVILDAFHTNPEVTLVATDAALIDADGNLIAESYFKPRGEFSPGFWANLIRNRFGGCTMAFRSEVISDILPLPHRYDVLHDLWIGVRNSLSGHKTLYIDQPLVLNRRHSTTTTGRRPPTFRRRLRTRLNLLLALVDFWVRRKREL